MIDNGEDDCIFRVITSKKKEQKEINDITNANITGKVEIIPIHT